MKAPSLGAFLHLRDGPARGHGMRYHDMLDASRMRFMHHHQSFLRA